MRLSDIAMIAANTSRTKAYVQAMAQCGVLPNSVLIMQDPDANPLPGQSQADLQVSPDDTPTFTWLELSFRPHESLETTLVQSETPFQKLPSTDIHSSVVKEAILARSETVFIYSGFGGVILRDTVLNIGKRFLHVHGGYLPDYKGSTTNYYSLLEQNECGASSIFMTAEIDGGPVILRRKFPPPPDRTQLDFVYDAIIRARVLVDTLQSYIEQKEWPLELERNQGGETYYIMHPTLRHIAILAVS